MSLRKLVDATVEPITLAEAKAHLRVTVSSEDALITALITAARTTCEERLRRTLIDTDWQLTLDAFPCALPLRMPRVIAVESVEYVDSAGAPQTLAGSEYQVDGESEPGWIVPAYGKAWPATREQANAVTVTYSCGYGVAASDVPGPIKQWILLQIGALYANREAVVATPGIVAVDLGFADRLLDPYRVIEI